MSLRWNTSSVAATTKKPKATVENTAFINTAILIKATLNDKAIADAAILAFTPITAKPVLNAVAIEAAEPLINPLTFLANERNGPSIGGRKPPPTSAPRKPRKEIGRAHV